jgi:hypothetical protein
MSEEYKKILRHNEAFYPKGKSIYSNESTNTFSRELKRVSGVDPKLSKELTEKLQKAENVLQRHAVLYAFIETHYQSNIQVDEFYQFLFKHLSLIEKSFSEYAERDEAKLESECAHPPFINPAELDNVSFFCRLPKDLLSMVDGYCELNEDEKSFLQHVARGDQRAAETMLKSDPQLLLCRGKMEEHNGRTFESATAFQYAVWAKDTDMMDMLMKYAPNDTLLRQALKDQLTELNAKGLTYTYNSWEWIGSTASKDGRYRKEVKSTTVNGSRGFDFTQLIEALIVYSQKFKALSGMYNDIYSQYLRYNDECCFYWQKVVGGAQRLVPVHVANHYINNHSEFSKLGHWSEVAGIDPHHNPCYTMREVNDFWSPSDLHGILGDTFALDVTFFSVEDHIKAIQAISHACHRRVNELLVEFGLLTPSTATPAGTG